MVDTSLNRKYEAKEGVQLDFSPIPKGEYTIRVKEISPWKEEIKNIKVIQVDENGKALLNEKGEKITTLENNCKFYNCNVKFEVVGGEYDGRLVFHQLTTHPNMSFNIPAYLYALGLNELSASEIQTETLNKMCLANVVIDTYDKHIQNKETALDEIVKKEVNHIKSFKQLPSNIPNNDLAKDLGI